MALSLVLMLGITYIAKLGGLEAHERELLNIMLTYSLLVSLGVTSWFNMIMTRYVSDMLYSDASERIMPSFYGGIAIMLVFCGLPYGIFLHFSGVQFEYKLLCLWYSFVLVVVWTEMIYLSAIKNYRGILIAFAISVLCGFLLALILILFDSISITGLMLCIIAAYGIMMTMFYKLMIDYFPKGKGSKFSFIRWFGSYRFLPFVGGLTNIGLYGHIIVMFFGPIRHKVEGLFYSATLYDVPALIAFFSILVTMVNFVTAVEVRFYPKYRDYYSLFNDHGTISGIMQAEDEMLTVLEQELTVNSQKQFISSMIFVVFGRLLMEKLSFGLSDTSFGIFMILCVGYGLYAIANSNMLILLYYEDHAGAFIGAAGFALVSIGATVCQAMFGDTRFFGLGFTAASAVYHIIIWLRLEWYTKRLPYFLLCRQELVPNTESGIFASLCSRLELSEEKRMARIESRRYKSAKRKLNKHNEAKEDSLDEESEKEKT